MTQAHLAFHRIHVLGYRHVAANGDGEIAVAAPTCAERNVNVQMPIHGSVQDARIAFAPDGALEAATERLDRARGGAKQTRLAERTVPAPSTESSPSISSAVTALAASRCERLPASAIASMVEAPC